MSSIREVARLANVSPATVSRVINGTANVDADKTERVLRAISETGFIPNEAARTLFKKSANMIGLVLPDIANPFFTQLASAIDKTAAQMGYRLFMYNTNDDPNKELAAFQALLSMNADGIILTSCSEKVKPLVETCKVPVVITDRISSVPGMDAYLYCDCYQGGRLATEHLIQCGCKRIVCMQAPQTMFSARTRYEGYRDVCREYGLEERVIPCDYDFNMGLTATEELLRRFPDVDGIVACNDMVAISAYKVLHKLGISVPDQIQIVGFDGIHLSSLLSPELTTVAQPIHEIGVKATELIIHNDPLQKGTKFVYPAALIVRETTKKKESST